MAVAKHKYDYYIYMESTPAVITWYIARRDTRRVVTSGEASDYATAIRDSALAWGRYERDRRDL